MKKIHNIILLCSEITRGMKSYGPKSFVPVSKHKIPFIIYQIQQIISTHGKNTSIYIVVGFEQEKFIKLIETEFPRRKYKHINNNMLGDCLKKAEKNILNINLIFIIR